MRNLNLHHELWFFKAIINQVKESIVVTDLDEKIIYVNNALEKITGYKKSELLGRHSSLIIAEETRYEEQQKITNIIKKGGTYKGCWKSETKDGKIFWMDARISQLFNNDNEIIGYFGEYRDITKEKEIENELLNSSQKYYSIFETSANLIVLVYANGIVKDCNRKVKEFLGYDKEEVVGSSVEKFIHPEYWDKAQLDMKKLIKDNALHKNEFRMIKKNGDVIEVSINSSSVKDEEGNFLHTVCTFSDVTEIKRNEIILRESSKELQARNKELEQFAYIVSHDLQEPLRVMSSYCELLKDKNWLTMDEEDKKLSNYIIDAAHRMKKLIKELLDFSRVGRKDKPFEVIDVELVLDEVLSDFHLLIEEAKADIIIESELPEVCGIKLRIKQLFHNLISNSLKYRNKEIKTIIRVGICKEPVENKESLWLFFVQDNGIGIESKYYDRIFGVFKRLYSREEYPGTGIGLALCKRIVETHGGKIWVDSTEGEGSCFYFSISKSIAAQ